MTTEEIDEVISNLQNTKEVMRRLEAEPSLQVQFLELTVKGGMWMDIGRPSFHHDHRYRIKPAPRKPMEIFISHYATTMGQQYYWSEHDAKGNPNTIRVIKFREVME